MTKRDASTGVYEKEPLKILISQPRPTSEKSPYFLLEEKYNVKLVFHPFIRIEGLAGKEFRKQKVDITAFKAVIFTSRHAIDHFFRISEELKININQDTKYFCISEAVALYLQKFILYRKRKVFFGANGTCDSLFDVINKHKNSINFLYVCSEHQQDRDIEKSLKDNDCDYKLGFMYRTVENNIKELFDKEKGFDIVCFYTPSGINAAIEDGVIADVKKAKIGTFGTSCYKRAQEIKLKVDIVSPSAQSPNMGVAIDHYLDQELSKKRKTKKSTTIKEKV